MEPSARIRPGFVLAVLAGLGLLFWLAMPRFKRHEYTHNAMIGAMRTIYTAQDARLSGSVAHGRPLRYDRGYRLELSGSATAWSCTATAVAGGLARYSFFVDESGTIRFSTSGPAGPSSPPVPAEGFELK